MEALVEEKIHCPYCGEQILVLIDPQESGHDYIEDCQVCCKPINFHVSTSSNGEMVVTARDENESL